MDAPAISAVSLRQCLASDRPPLVIDVRRGERWREAPDLIRGALRRDPLRVDDWAGTFPAASTVVVYCAHGHEVSQDAAKALAAMGLNASFLFAGIEGWRFHPLGNARAAQDRPHRLPLAGRALRRSGGGVPLCADK